MKPRFNEFFVFFSTKISREIVANTKKNLHRFWEAAAMLEEVIATLISEL